MADLPARVDELENRVDEHHTVLFGPKDCPEVGMVKQFSEVKTLIDKQTVYNGIMTFFAAAVALAIVAYVMGLILR